MFHKNKNSHPSFLNFCFNFNKSAYLTNYKAKGKKNYSFSELVLVKKNLLTQKKIFKYNKKNQHFERVKAYALIIFTYFNFYF